MLPEVFSQKSPVLAIFCQKTAIYRHHPLFIAFLCGNEVEKNRQMAKIGDFCHFSGLQNRRFGDKSPLLVILWDNLTLKLRNQNNIKSIQQILTREAIFYFQCPTSISQFVTVEELILFGKKTFLTFMYMFDPSILTNM